MNAMWPKGSVGHEWEVDRHRHCGLMQVVVNATSHLWQVSSGPGVGSTRAVPFRHTQPPLSGSTTPDPLLGAMGCNRG
jgi:hypothetical protein